ncbi:MAG TPA: 4Fe-4S dicluster domain-containing protein [Polyangiaceae bacterium]
MSKRAPYSSGNGNGSLPASVDTPEFPKGHVDTPPSEESMMLSRRGLLGAMSATLALVGAEGCRRPIEKIVPYTRMPEDVIPGIPSHYATVYQRRSDALGLVVECHEGRPTKIEGNEAHPSSFGAADLVAQASILDLYDPERSTTPLKGGAPASWDDFERELGAKLAGYDKDQGAKLRLLMEPTISPTVLRMRAALAQRFPKARVHTWSAVADSNVREGARLAFGKPMMPLYLYDRAHVVLSLDSDFLQTESGSVRATKAFSASRRLRRAGDTMNRLYVVEPARTTTGNMADHRLRLPAGDVERYTYALAAELAKAGVSIAPEVTAAIGKKADANGIPTKWLGVVARELAANRGRGIIVVGSRQPARVHAVVHAINAALGNVGATVGFAPVADASELDVAQDIKALTDAMGGGQVDALLILGGNPVYDAPADLAFGDKLAKVPFTAHASLFADETSEKCTWHVPLAHEYESWGDAQALDGSIAVRQPLIAPLYAGRSDIELLALAAKAPEKSGHEAVQSTAEGIAISGRQLTACGAPDDMGTVQCKDASGNAIPVHTYELERDWTRALAAGVLQRAQAKQLSPALEAAAIGSAVGAAKGPAAANGYEVTFAPCPKMVDGRHANNTWLQEMPDPVTKLVWDNAAILSPATAKELGVENKDWVKIGSGDKSITAAVWIVRGQADKSIALTLGWGRKKAGRIGNGRGFDAYPLRTTDSLGWVSGASVSKADGEPYFFAQTQDHDSSENRPIAHEATLAEYSKQPNFPAIDAPPLRALPLWQQQDYSKGHQWGMAIDLNACTGCGACFVACMSENNVPVVGKLEVWRGREMHWLRIDRYYHEGAEAGGSEDSPLEFHEPVMCVHCEEAPCENVCPVNATTHGPEGLNEMAYNRCIGTRYCGNNCPYKVRRFNYLNWHNDSVWKETGGLPETLTMQQNPNVTVRFRGVMEKCTYCVQRIQATKIAAKRQYRDVKDGEIRTACQQTCPADAIVFGDVNDMNSAVSRTSRIDRRFALLQELGTRPRTSYLGKVRNPNPEML